MRELDDMDPPHEHNWQAGDAITGSVYVEEPYLRVGEVVEVMVFAEDWDHCTTGCWFPECPNHGGEPGAYNGGRVLDWDDGDAGGQFGRMQNGQFVVATQPSEVTHYKAPDEPQIVDVRAQLDDDPHVWDPETQQQIETHDDAPVWSLPGRITVWDFTISPCPSGLPTLDGQWTFTAKIRPETDHNNQSMAAPVVFWLVSSREPGHCLNAMRTDDDPHWHNTTEEDLDLKFAPSQPGFLEQEVSSTFYDYDVSDPNPQNEYDPDNFNWAVTTQPWTTKSIGVTCLDFGAFGLIGAEAIDLPPGSESSVDARLEGTTPAQDRFGAPIPVDEDDPRNYIADSWEHNAGDPRDDNEPNPFREDGTHKGDGYTRYEEYRGVMYQGQHMRLDPDTSRDVFVLQSAPDPLPIGGFQDLGLTLWPDCVKGNPFVEEPGDEIWAEGDAQGRYPYLSALVARWWGSFHREQMYAAHVMTIPPGQRPSTGVNVSHPLERDGPLVRPPTAPPPSR